MLRLVYVGLIRVIKTFKDKAAVDRLAGKMPRKRGCCNTSVVINNYLDFKGIASDRKLIRT
jgi:hypothetical protein